MKSAKSALCIAALLGFVISAGGLRAQAPAPSEWVGAWAASQQIPEPQNSLPPDALRDATLRQIVHLSIGGDTLRVHVSNAFGTQPLLFTSVHIARALTAGSSSAIDAATDRAVTFNGSPSVTVPAGAEYISDPVHLEMPALSSLAITIYFPSPPARETGHPGSRADAYYVHGNQVSAPSLTGAQAIEHWYQISGVDLLAPAGAGAVVALGDSITDGHATTTNGNDRWTDDLAARLQASPSTRDISVLNQGIGGNCLLTQCLGPNTLARFDRDVLAQPGVRWLIVFEGVNDLGGLTFHGPVAAAAHQELVRRVIGAYQQIIQRAHAHGIEVIGATITPFAGSGYYHPDAATLADLDAVNAWIRARGHFDAVLDFNKVIADPTDPERLKPEWDSGDHLHPGPAGYRALADSIPLNLF
ncbi:MAG: SGNH/GDSL hydrolase family protein [Acidobacteriaceae bacterium]